jgi:hypothetical protein
VFLRTHQSRPKKRKEKIKTRRMGGNAVRVDLIWEDGERREKEGGKRKKKEKALDGRRGGGGRGLTG